MDLKSLFNNRLINEFEPLLHKTLHKLQITKYHLNHDDYLQELRIKLVEIADNFDGKPLGEDRYRFTAFAQRGLHWHIVSLLRKENRYKKNMEKHVNDLLDTMSVFEPGSEGNIYLVSFMEEVKKRLTKDEYALLLFFVDGRYTGSDIADIFGLNRSTVYDRKNIIKGKLANLRLLLT